MPANLEAAENAQTTNTMNKIEPLPRDSERSMNHYLPAMMNFEESPRHLRAPTLVSEVMDGGIRMMVYRAWRK